MNVVPESIRATLLKVKALAEAGADGERAVALTKLAELLTKHGMTEADLSSEEVEMYFFEYSDWAEDTLLRCIVCHLAGDGAEVPAQFMKRGQRPSTRRVGYKLTKVQYADVEAAFAHYRRTLNTEMVAFVRAFLNAQGLARNIKRDRPLTEEEMRKSRKAGLMMTVIDRTPFRRVLENSKSG